MKRFILGGLSLALITAMVAPAARAQESIKAAAAPLPAKFHTDQLQPFHLVYLGYQGLFRAQGIPTTEAFLNSGVTPEELVEAAVNTGRLSTEVLDDTAYLDLVKTHLRTLHDVGDT